MQLDEILEYFGSYYQISKKCKFSQAAPFTWRFRGFIPLQSQKKIELITEGLFKASEDDARHK